MKTLTGAVMVSLALLSAGAYASPNGDSNNQPFEGVYGAQTSNSLTRAQVQAELAQAKAAGLVSNVEPNDTPFNGVYGEAQSSSLTRAQVEGSVAAQNNSGQAEPSFYQGA